MHNPARTTAMALTLGLATAAVARDGDVLPPPSKSILAWSPAEQAAGYRRIEDVNKVEVIARGAKVHPLLQSTRPEPKIDFIAGGQTYDLDSYMKSVNASGVLVLKDGKIVLERYGLGRTAEDRWTSFSVAASVTSTLVGAAIKDGSIKSLDDAVTRYIPDLKGSAYDRVTVRQLLTMTSGVKWNEDYADPRSDVSRAGFEPVPPGKNPIVAYLSRLPSEAEPGTKFLYKTGETDLAGILVSSATGKSLAQYASEKIWRPYGMERDAIWMVDGAGHERGGCCISMTLRDYGRLGQFVLDGGAGQLPRDWTRQATRKQVEIGEDPSSIGYGYFWWIAKDGYDARGIFGQLIHTNPKERLIIVTNAAWPKATGEDLIAIRSAFVEAVTKAVH